VTEEVTDQLVGERLHEREPAAERHMWRIGGRRRDDDHRPTVLGLLVNVVTLGAQLLRRDPGSLWNLERKGELFY
jgi:hypothetical protein